MGKFLDSIVSAAKGPATATPPPAAPQGDMDSLLATAMGQQPQSQAPSFMDNQLANIYSPQVAGPDPQAQAQAPAMGMPTATPDNPYTPMDNVAPQEIANSIGTPDQPQADINVVGDNWKPHKESFLGRIMDTLTQLDGHAPIFQNRTDDRNLQSAMEGLDGNLSEPGSKDHDLLIQRVKKFNPTLAASLQDKFHNQDRQDRSADHADDVFDLRKDDVYRQRAASRLNGATAETYPKLRELTVNFLKSKGEDDVAAELPETFDKFDVNSFVMGEVPVKDQIKIGQTDTKIKQGDRRLDQRDTSISNQKEHGDQMAGIAQENADTSKTNSDKKPDKDSRVVMTKHGPMEVRGNRGVIMTPDGVAHLFLITPDGGAVHIQNIAPKKGK